MPRTSAGLLLYRRTATGTEVLLVHPGGPYHARRDLGAWSIPKGEYDDEDPFDSARREFAEELGNPAPPPTSSYLPLGEVRQKGGKLVVAWAVEGDLDPDSLTSNAVEIEWPPRSGRTLAVPEVDRAQWFPLPDAAGRINAAQVAFLDRLADHLADHLADDHLPDDGAGSGGEARDRTRKS